MPKLDELLDQFAQEVDGLVLTAIVYAEDGTPVAGYSPDEELDFSIPAVFFGEVLRKGIEAARETSWGTFQESLLATDRYYIFSRLLGGGSYFHLTVIPRTANWGIVRVKMLKYAQALESALP